MFWLKNWLLNQILTNHTGVFMSYWRGAQFYLVHIYHLITTITHNTTDSRPRLQTLSTQYGKTCFGTLQFQVGTIQFQVVTREFQLGTVWFQGQDEKFRNSELIFCPKFRNYLVINILEAHSCELWFTHERLQFSVILELSGTNFAGTRDF